MYQLIRALFLLICFCGSGFAQSQPLVLNTSYSSPITSPDKTGFLDLLYKELFGRLGIAFEIQALPAERCLQNANAGIDDGDVCRIADLVNIYTNFVRTNETVMQYNHAVFSKDKVFEVKGSESLKPYSVGIVTGWKIVERNTKDTSSRFMVDSADQLFHMLDNGHIDVAIIEQMVGLETVSRLDIKGVKLLSPPLLSGDWFLYLHKKHSHLIPRIDEELRKMKNDGTYDRIWNTVRQRYGQSILN